MDDDLDVDGLNLPIYSFNPYQVELAPLAVSILNDGTVWNY